MNKINIILFSESSKFLYAMKTALESYKIIIQSTIKNIEDIDVKNKENLYIVKIPSENTEKKEKIMNFFDKNALKWICISDNVKISFISTSKGAIEHIILKARPTNIEFRIFIKLLSIKIKEVIDAINEEKKQYNNAENNIAFNKIIAIGASTGGTEAITEILTKLEKNTPPIVIVIHMPSGFTYMYAKKLNEICKMYVKEAKNKENLRNGVVYIAKGGKQVRIEKENGEFLISCGSEVKVNGHCPSVDVLFDSLNKIDINKIAVLLTGMGNDGAKKITEIKQNGGLTIGQDKGTSVVYGMPRVAYELGGIVFQAPIYDIAKIIQDNI